MYEKGKYNFSYPQQNCFLCNRLSVFHVNGWRRFHRRTKKKNKLNKNRNHSSEIRNLISKKCKKNNVVINAASSPWAYFGCFSGFQFAAQIKWVLSYIFCHSSFQLKHCCFYFSCENEQSTALTHHCQFMSLENVKQNFAQKKHTRILISNETNICQIDGVMWSFR